MAELYNKLRRMGRNEFRRYVQDEGHLWDRILDQAQAIVDTEKKRRMAEEPAVTLAFFWPADNELIAAGEFLDVVPEVVPDYDEERTIQLLKDRVVELEAYALLLLMPSGNAVNITVESHHGSRWWSLRKERHGDIDVVVVTPKDNQNCIGILWKPKKAQA